jgi:hypothetical protein
VSIALNRDLTGGEMAQHRSIGGQHHHVVVFLHRHDDLVLAVDRDEFGLRVFRRDAGKAGHIRSDHARAVECAIGKRHDRDETGRHLRHAPVARVLVALVLDRHGDEGPVGRHGHAVRLPAEVAGPQYALRDPRRWRAARPKVR